MLINAFKTPGFSDGAAAIFVLVRNKKGNSDNGMLRNTLAQIIECAIVFGKHIVSSDNPPFSEPGCFRDGGAVTCQGGKADTADFSAGFIYGVIATAAGRNIPKPEEFSDVGVFLNSSNDEKQYAILRRFPKSKIGRSQILKKRFVMCVRPSMKNYLKGLFERGNYSEGILLYSMWDGYTTNKDVADFLL